MQMETGMRDIQQRTTTIGFAMRVLEILNHNLEIFVEFWCVAY